MKTHNYFEEGALVRVVWVPPFPETNAPQTHSGLYSGTVELPNGPHLQLLPENGSTKVVFVPVSRISGIEVLVPNTPAPTAQLTVQWKALTTEHRQTLQYAPYWTTDHPGNMASIAIFDPNLNSFYLNHQWVAEVGYVAEINTTPVEDKPQVPWHMNGLNGPEEEGWYLLAVQEPGKALELEMQYREKGEDGHYYWTMDEGDLENLYGAELLGYLALNDLMPKP